MDNWIRRVDPDGLYDITIAPNGNWTGWFQEALFSLDNGSTGENPTFVYNPEAIAIDTYRRDFGAF